MKLVSFGRRSRAATQAPLGPLEAALQPAWVDGRWRVPDRFNFTRDVVEALADDTRRRALMFLGADGVIEPWTFTRLAEGAGAWAARLREQGVRPGDRVVVVIGKSPSWIEVMLAGMKVGAVTVPCSPTISRAALEIRVAGAGAKLVVADHVPAVASLETVAGAAVLDAAEVHDRLQRMSGEEPTHDTASRDLAFLLTTSGGGAPYGVEHTHAAAFAARAQAEHWLDARRGDVVWCTADTASPLAVWLLLLGPWARGAEVVLHEGAFDPEERLDLIRRFEVTILCQSPSEYRALTDAGERTLGRYLPDRLRRMVSTGDFLSSDVVSTFEQAWGMPIEDGWGQTETGLVIGHGADDGLESGSIGQPLPGHDIAIVDESGAEIGPGGEGQLALRGRPPTLFAGYWDAPEETKAVFRGDLYLTGDLACREEDGSVRLLGRAADVITSGGRRFGPFEVEQALVEHRAVANAGVVGMRDLQRGGQYVRAFVVLAPGAEASDRLVAEIRQHLRHTLPEDMVPREVEFVDELPTAANGTILRHELRERTAVATEGAWSKAPRLPGTPAPVTTFEAPPEPPRPTAVAVEDEEPLPDFVVHPSETYAASLDLDAGSALDVEPDDEELPDYIVVPELVPEPLPEHVVSFLNAQPLPEVPIEPEPKPEPRPEPRTVPILQEARGAKPEPDSGPEPESRRAPAAEADLEAEVKAESTPAPAPMPAAAAEPKPKPRTRPIRDPQPPVTATAPPAPAAKPPPPPPPVPEPVVAKAPPVPKAAPPAPAKPAPRPAAAPPPAPVAQKPPPTKPKPASKAPPKPVAKKPTVPTRARVPEPEPAPPPAPDPTPAPAPPPPAPTPPPPQPPAPPQPDPEPPKEPEVARKRKPAPAPPAPANGEAKRRGRRRRKEKEHAEPAVAQAGVQRSAPEPGMENPDVDFIKDLSSRLSAYSIAADEAAGDAPGPA